MKTRRIILLFSHNTLARRWKQLADQLKPCGIELIVLSQHSPIDWDSFLVKELPEADVLYLEFTGHSPVFGRIVESAKKLPFVLPSGMDAQTEFPNSNVKQVECFRQHMANASMEDLETGIFYLLQEYSKAVGEWDSSYPEVAPPRPAKLCAVGDPATQQIFDTISDYLNTLEKVNPLVPLFYGRRYWIADDLEIIAELVKRFAESGYTAVPIFCDFTLGNHINDPGHPVAALLRPHQESIIASLNLAFSNSAGEARPDALFSSIGKPVFQLIRDYSRTEKEWRESPQETLLGMTYNFSVVQPETLGTIEPHLVGVNSIEKALSQGETPLSVPVDERVNRLIARIRRWHYLQVTPNADKRIVIVLHNSPCKGVEATLGTAAGLHAAQSAVDLMHRMKVEGYRVEDLPGDGAALLKLIQERKAHSEFRWTNTETIVAKGGVIARVGEAKYGESFDCLPESMREAINAAWDPFPGEGMVHPNERGEPELLITGIHFGNVTVMVEAKRGCYGPKCDGEVCRILHQPDIPPTHHWLATAWYIQEHFDAIVQMGAESSLDYLPGKPVALSETCYPDLSLGELPRLYPYIMDSVGEGLLAKRRGKGTMINHLTPPVRKVGDEDLSIASMNESYRQILHARSNGHQQRVQALEMSLREELVERGFLEKVADHEAFETALQQLSRRLRMMRTRVLEAGKHVLGQVPDEENMCLYVEESTRAQAFEELELREGLSRTGEEMDHLMDGLNGRFIPAGQAGALSSGRANLLPTGKNFYAMDLKTIPTPAAWKVGVEMGQQLLRKYLDDEGAFPESIGVTLWSSDAFMAEGELTSQCLWLLGCRPVWTPQGTVKGIEVMPQEELTLDHGEGSVVARPRIDCVVRMSGVVRDLLQPVYLLIDDAVSMVAGLDEPESVNCVRKHVNERFSELEKELDSLGSDELRRLASARLFTDSAGSYGAGVGLAVDASAWKDEKDLANAFVNWTGGVCGRQIDAVVQKVGNKGVMQEFSRQIKGIDVAYQRAISSKYDALSIGCYTGYQGGMAVTQRAMGGKKLRMYWGDSQSGPTAEVRDLEDEVDLALTSRLMSPDWVRGKMKEGYTGATDLSSLVNTLFAWSATTGVVRKRHFDLVTRRIVEDPEVREWLMRENVYALEEISRRLLEAHSRELWKADDDELRVVQETMLELEGDIEDRMGPVKGEFQGSSVDIKTSEDVDRWKWKTEIGVTK